MVESGLFVYEKYQVRPVPLQNVCVEASVYDLCAEVKVRQVFLNNSTFFYGDGELECVFIFPLDEESAVFSFTCDLDGHVVHAQIKEKAQARAAYTHAVQANIPAMLLEQLTENVFTCRIGRIRPGSTCIITISYLTLLDQEGRFNRLTLPLFIAPKYTPATHTPPRFSDPFWKLTPAPQLHVQAGHGCDSCFATPIIGPRFHCPQCHDFDLCDACHTAKGHHHPMEKIVGPASSGGVDTVHLNPMRPMPSSVQAKIEALIIKVSVCMPSHILSIQCTSHSENTHIQQETGTTADVFFRSQSECFLSKDFILRIEQEACFEPRALCELDIVNRTAAVCLAFIPRPLNMMAASQLQCELVFVIDCSGSMMGSSIACVRDCMQLLLRSLPVNSLFNIIRFGSNWFSLFPSSSPYNDETLHAATQHVLGLVANLGGTEMYAPLEYALCNDLHTTHPRQVFLLTDAQVSNVDNLVHLVSKHARNMRLFTFGIGNAADRSLCKRLARAGNGKSEFVSMDDMAEGGLRDKVIRQVGRALQPAFTDVNVDWKGLANDNAISTELNKMSIAEKTSTSTVQSAMAPGLSISSFHQCPSVAPAIFVNSRFVLHALNANISDAVWQQAVSGQPVSMHEEICICAHASSPNESGYCQATVVLTGEQLTQATVIHTMAARARIKELEELVITETRNSVKKQLEDELLGLSLRYTLSSSMASFVAVFDNGDVEPVQVDRPMKLISSFFLPSTNGLFGSAPMGLNFNAVGSAFGGSPAAATGSTFGATSLAFSACSIPTSANTSLCDERFSCAPCSLPYSPTSPRFGGPSRSSDTFSSGPGGSNPHTSWGFFQGLISLQSAKGTWDITQQLVDIIRAGTSSLAMTIESMKIVCFKHGVSEQVVATLTALLFLDTHYNEKQSEWQLLAMKSRFYLANTANIHDDLQAKIIADIKLLGV